MDFRNFFKNPLIVLGILFTVLKENLSLTGGINVKKVGDGSYIGDIRPSHASHEELHVFCRDAEEKALNKVWKKVTLRLNFSSSSTYELFEEATAQQVTAMYQEHQKSWFHLWPMKTTEVKFNLFNATCIGIATREPYRVIIETEVIHLTYLLLTIAAAGLFYSANRLSKNILFYYGTGMTVGVIASLLIVVFMLSRLVPGRRAGYVLIMSGFSTIAALLRYLWRTQVLKLIEDYYQLVVAYIAISSLLTFIILYWFGPPTNPRSLNVVKWVIQLIAVSGVYYSMQVSEAAIAMVTCLLIIYHFPTSLLHWAWLTWRLWFPPRKRFITMEEYHEQADEVTRKALDDLRTYCRSPDCDAWKTVSRLRSPYRFAKFIEGSSHVTDDELLAYDSGDSNLLAPSLSDDNSDDELDFRLSTQ